jgi:tetratricopeptide (TPR) repeat protein
LARLEGAETPAGPAESMLKAQCLARLGRSREAVETAQAALRRNPDDADLLYQSAIVLSLAGDRSSALSNALAALDKGVQPRWFSGSTFAWLRETPEMRPYLTPVSSSPLPRPDRRAADRPTPRAAGL